MLESLPSLARSRREGPVRFLIEQIPWGMVASCALSALLAGMLVRRASRAPGGTLVALALQSLWAAWTFAGMEAVFFAAALAGATAWMTAESEAGRPRLGSAIAFGLLVWIRPEGALFAGCAFLALHPWRELLAGRWRDA